MQKFADYLRRPGVIAGVLVSLVALGMYARFAPSSNAEQVAKDMLGIEACVQKNAPITCSQPFVSDLIKLEKIPAILDTFAEKYATLQCHYLGHSVGQALYREYDDLEPALSQCNRTCDSACIHGAVGEAFTDAMGEESENYDPAHLSVADILYIGKILCNGPSPCHGVGHVLFQRFQDFKPAIDACEAITPGPIKRMNCYRGVYMEYGDALAAKSIWASSTTVLPNIFSRCDTVSQEVKGPCYWYFPPTLAKELATKGADSSKEKVIKIVAEHCQTLTTADREACMTSIGVYEYRAAIENVAAGRKICTDLGQVKDISACERGMLSLLFEYDKPELGLSMCALANGAEKEACFDSLFWLTGYTDVDYERMSGLCDDKEPLCALMKTKYGPRN